MLDSDMNSGFFGHYLSVKLSPNLYCALSYLSDGKG